MDASVLLNWILGGGLLVTITGLITLKAAVLKANAEAHRAASEAETVKINNVDSATRILVENIVEPLKQELIATRNDLQDTKKELGATKREMVRLRKAVDDAAKCPHNGVCPVLQQLRCQSPDDSGGDGNGHASQPDGQHHDDGQRDDNRAG